MKVRLRLVFGNRKAITIPARHIDPKGMVYVMTYPRDARRPLRCVPGQLISVTKEEAARLIANREAMTPTDDELRAYLPIKKKAGSAQAGLPGAKVG